MHDQPKFIPLRSSEFYSDRRSARYPVPGTIPRTISGDSANCSNNLSPEGQESMIVDKEQLDPNSYFLTGKHGNLYGNDLPNDLPFKVDTPAGRQEILVRGQERYTIYCSPCHSELGDGNGMIVQRGYKRPPSFHVQRLRNAPLGWFYDVISNGFGGMPDYAAQVKPADRWAIAAYIRALQRSQNPLPEDLQDLPEAEREKLNKPDENEIRIPDTSIKPPAPRPEGGVKR